MVEMESIRSCLVCRNKGERGRLLRFVRALDGEIGFDEKAVLQSRGAWICANKSCLTKAFDKRMLFRGERVLPISSKDMIEQINSRLKTSLLGSFGLLRRLGQCDSGRDAVKSLVSAHKAALVLYASDFSERSVREVKESLGEHYQLPILKSPFSMEEIGNCLGRKKTGVVALAKSRITEEIVVKLNMLAHVSQ